MPAFRWFLMIEEYCGTRPAGQSSYPTTLGADGLIAKNRRSGRLAASAAGGNMQP
ncbi:hypothetical protein G7048_20775 [Diaphorobacter sp. HDW4B]|uniref:hypothetical protein n=1 Tax=Diaphorobacter sp. HDW4B TaxID=2714925 RepID=UPI00140DFBF7|nr:hypothetical protein [Diaphorobacter sp. HDW4B]QIL72575.1 hypothetical protein G7048_20775 [Diaphorobacter sp. HDW4B]